jgi:hypothetical protein
VFWKLDVLTFFAGLVFFFDECSCGKFFAIKHETEVDFDLTSFLLLQITLSFYVGFLLFEDFPTSLIVCGIISQVAHLFILKTFPFVVIASPAFIVGVIMLIINHYLAFQYFASVYYSFSEVCSSFTSIYFIRKTFLFSRLYLS